MAEISDEVYEELRLILEEQYSQPLMLEDAKEIGDGLVDFYSVILKLYNNDK